jgi:AraC-like DNA-binding protein
LGVYTSVVIALLTEDDLWVTLLVRNWKPAVVHLMMDSNKIITKNRILDDCVLMFSQNQTAIAFPAGLLDATVGTTPDIRSAAIQHTNEHQSLDENQDKSEFVDTLRGLISLYITEAELTIEVIADLAGLSTRSLQRIMKKHNLSYNELLNEARHKYAVTKLSDPTAKITDIAYQLGYNDAAHFTRAFKRWTGMTPSKFRSTQK